MINNRHITLCAAAVCSMLFGACCNSSFEGRQHLSFNDGWLFALTTDTSASQTDYADSEWRQLSLPHDWAVEGDFSQDNPSGTGGGALPGGMGWYRKHFTTSVSDSNKIHTLEFGGIYMNSSVYVNGKLVGRRPYGYISFAYDISSYLKWGSDNVVAVCADNSRQPNSRWYSGCGIYRNVWLTKTDPLHVSQWGTYAKTIKADADSAILEVSTTVANQHKEYRELTVRTTLIDAKGHSKAQEQSYLRINTGESITVQHLLTTEKPNLWSTDNPYLYKIKTELLAGGRCLDEYYTTVGLRSFAFDADRGFSLNGVNMKINGVCMHHDLGCLGAAINTRGIERQLEILKDMGCNAIRCSHNPPSPELLDLCDKMGFIVMDEAFDMWRKKKTSYDYARFFNQWHERDLTDLIVRDRNHPCVMMWSIGNEVLEQWSDAKADTLTLEEANLILNFGHPAEMLAKKGEISVNSELTCKLAGFVRKLDDTRPITAGCNEGNPNNHLFRSGALDIIGYNYNNGMIADVPKNFPGKPFIITESNSALMTRGFYHMPSDEMVICPKRWDLPYVDTTFACSSYDNCRAPWGSHHEETLKIIRDNDFVSGQFIWTGFDYIGEPTPYGWPARSSYFGIVDLAGFPKDIYYLYQSEWTDKQVLHLFPHWNWTEGQEVDLWCFYNNADEVELFVNGKTQGIRSKDADNLHVMWRVAYEPGTIKAVARKNGQNVATAERHTAGKPAAIRLTADRETISADGRDLSFITVEVVDSAGTLCPNADNLISFKAEGNATIAGVDNGSPISMERFKADNRRAFYGKCLVVLQNNGTKGKATLTATSEGLTEKTISISSR